MKRKTVFIVGPTGVGKTDLALKLAAQMNGELISADSVQVYKGLDIISGKDIPKNSPFTIIPARSHHDLLLGLYLCNGISLYLLDVVAPTYPFTVSHFQKLAGKILNLIFAKNKLPIVVGGTGLYIKSITEGLDVLPGSNKKLRINLENLTVQQLQSMLSNVKLQKMNDSDRNNKRRLIRAIEISKAKSQESEVRSPKYDTLVIGLTAPREVLKKRIDKRVEDRLKNGALREAESLFENYKNLTRQVKDANGYKQLFDFLENKISLPEAIYRWKISEYHHAKNQMTWFKKYGDVKWFDISKKDFQKEIENTITNFI